MEELVERLVRWDIHPADLITHRFSLDDVAEQFERVRKDVLAWLAAAPLVIAVSGDAEAIGNHFAEQPPQGRRGAPARRIGSGGRQGRHPHAPRPELTEVDLVPLSRRRGV